MKDPKNRTFILSTFLALLFLVFSVLGATLSNRLINEKSWLPSFLKILYSSDDGFNIALVIFQIIVLALVYFFGLLSIATFSEMRANLPSWSEIFIAFFLVAIFAAFIPGMEADQTVHLSDTSERLVVFISVMLLQILLTLYIATSADEE